MNLLEIIFYGQKLSVDIKPKLQKDQFFKCIQFNEEEAKIKDLESKSRL